MQKITPCLWFDGNALEAVNFYISVFNNTKITDVMYYGEAGPGPVGSILTITFKIESHEFVALNGGPEFTFTPAISFMVNCETQKDIDEYWEKLSAGGEVQQCGWLTDKFGVSWQIVPSILLTMLQDPDTQRSQRVMSAMLQMGKLDIARLKQAYEA